MTSVRRAAVTVLTNSKLSTKQTDVKIDGCYFPIRVIQLHFQWKPVLLQPAKLASFSTKICLQGLLLNLLKWYLLFPIRFTSLEVHL